MFNLTIATFCFNIPFHVVYKTKENKFLKENEELKLLHDYDVECIVLACYMQILLPQFVLQCQNKIINIHHSFLPAFKGAKPYHQAYQHGVKIKDNWGNQPLCY